MTTEAQMKNVIKNKDGILLCRFKIGERRILIPLDRIEKANEKGISKHMIASRLSAGWQVDDALNVPKGETSDIKRLYQEERERKERAKWREKTKLLKEQARLEMIRKHKRRDPYWFDITWNQMFKGW